MSSRPIKSISAAALYVAVDQFLCSQLRSCPQAWRVGHEKYRLRSGRLVRRSFLALRIFHCAQSRATIIGESETGMRMAN